MNLFTCLRALLVVALCSSGWAHAFSALVSPPRIETQIQAGQTIRQIIEITHASNTPGKYKMYTNDWKLNAAGAVDFFDDLQPGSCRPWVALERREISLGAQGKSRYRFEVTAPADITEGECRFVIMIEGETQDIPSQNINLPVAGRIGVIVYVALGNAAPKLEVVGASVITTGTSTTAVSQPTIEVRNTGTATGRLGGFLSGTDASGKKLEFSPEGSPILPGASRKITLVPSLPGSNASAGAAAASGAAAVQVRYPVTVEGQLEWGRERVKFEQRFVAP
jgi:hypothetical protein